MITPAMMVPEDLIKSCLRDYHNLTDSLKTASSVLEELAVNKFSIQEIEQPCLVQLEFSTVDEIVIDSYFNPKELIVALLCESIDKDSDFSVEKYFRKLSEFKEIEEEVIRKISEFQLKLSVSDYTNLDNVINNNKEIIVIMEKLIKDRLPKRLRIKENCEDSDSDRGCPLFWKRIKIKNSKVSEDCAYMMGSKFCNGLFAIKKSKFSRYTLKSDDIIHYRRILEDHKSTRFDEQTFLLTNKKNDHSILFSIYLLEVVNYRVEGVLEIG